MTVIHTKTYIIGWVNCPVCGEMIECVKRRTGFIMVGKKVFPKLPNAGQMIYRPKMCPACGEVYKVTHTEFYGKIVTDCPDGTLMVMGEARV